MFAVGAVGRNPMPFQRARPFVSHRQNLEQEGSNVAYLLWATRGQNLEEKGTIPT